MFTRCIKSLISTPTFYLGGVAALWLQVTRTPPLGTLCRILSVLGSLIIQLVGANLGNVLLYREERERKLFLHPGDSFRQSPPPSRENPKSEKLIFALLD